jgi:5'-nucleotidase
MATQVKRVLLTNDDGFDAPGLSCVARALLRNPDSFDIRICSPSSGKSGASHSITISKHILARKVTLPGQLSSIDTWNVDGTPVDCVKVALSGGIFGKWSPDLVISGCNYGLNAGLCILSSGTVGAALESALTGIPSIAFSIDFMCGDKALPPHVLHWDVAEEVVDRVVRSTVENKLESGFVLNVNIPNLPFENIKGIRLCHQGNSGYDEAMVEKPYKGQLGGDVREFSLEGSPFDKDNDVAFDTSAVLQAYVAVTPLSLQFRAPDYENNWNKIHEWLRDMPLK